MCLNWFNWKKKDKFVMHTDCHDRSLVSEALYAFCIYKSEQLVNICLLFFPQGLGKAPKSFGFWLFFTFREH